MSLRKHDNSIITVCQVSYPFDPIPKGILIAKAKMKISCVAKDVFDYLLWQNYGFPNKDGDSIGYGTMAKQLDHHRISIIKAIKELLKNNMILKNIKGGRYGNVYRINTNINSWHSSPQTTSNLQATSSSQTTITSKLQTTTLVARRLPNNKQVPVNNINKYRKTFPKYRSIDDLKRELGDDW